MSDRIDIPAVSDRDLSSILDRFGLSERMEAGEMECASCGAKLMWDSIGALVTSGKTLIIYCSDSACVEAAIASQRRHDSGGRDGST